MFSTSKKISNYLGNIGYKIGNMWTEICCQISLLFMTSIIGQFIHPVVGYRYFSQLQAPPIQSTLKSGATSK